MANCFKFELRLENAWHTAKIFTDDAKKIRINKNLRRFEVKAYVKKVHRFCLN